MMKSIVSPKGGVWFEGYNLGVRMMEQECNGRTTVMAAAVHENMSFG
jgi:hypothetical protein